MSAEPATNEVENLRRRWNGRSRARSLCQPSLQCSAERCARDRATHRKGGSVSIEQNDASLNCL